MRGTNARPASPEKPLLLSDPRVPAVQVRDCGEPLTALGESFGPCRALVRVSVARRLAQARDALPPGVRLRVVAPGVARRARANRELLARVLRGAGLVNYPTEWWHWSYGDRYWALVTGAQAALYGPVAADRVAR
jgi:D-alanyl-D-alanine dipeptidase